MILPKPREVSEAAHDFDRRRLSTGSSVMLMEWGQFLAHDLVGTPVGEYMYRVTKKKNKLESVHRAQTPPQCMPYQNRTNI